MFIAHTPATVMRLFCSLGLDPGGALMAALLCLPSQGFMNYLIFVRDKPTMLRKKSNFSALRGVVPCGGATARVLQRPPQPPPRGTAEKSISVCLDRQCSEKTAQHFE
jgi:hypothetical protein